jgi:N-acetyl-anhydromuramyl-L-alanine amidase AmpD
MKKVLILIVFFAVGVFILVKYYPRKSQNIEIKSDNQTIASVEKNISDDNSKNSEVKTEENIPQTSDAGKKDINIINKLVSWGYEKADTRKIDTIIIHSSYNALGGGEYDADGLIKEYKIYGVSPHYLIDRKGNIYQLVADKNIAYHAGESKVPDGRKSVNNFSIGIELMNTESDKYTSEQYAALKSLIASLKSKYKIKYVLGHNQIATGRKTDPWNFDWGQI